MTFPVSVHYVPSSAPKTLLFKTEFYLVLCRHRDVFKLEAAENTRGVSGEKSKHLARDVRLYAVLKIVVFQIRGLQETRTSLSKLGGKLQVHVAGEGTSVLNSICLNHKSYIGNQLVRIIVR